MQSLGTQDAGLEALEQRHQRRRAATDLVSQGRQTDRHALLGITLGLPVERLMLAKLLEWRWRAGRRRSCTASGLTALSSGGPGKLQRGENHQEQTRQENTRSSTERWNDVPRGTMDEASSYIRLDLLSVRRQGRPKADMAPRAGQFRAQLTCAGSQTGSGNIFCGK